MTEIIPLNRLLESASSIFQLALVFRSKDRGANLPQNFREQIISAFDQLEQNTFKYQIATKQVQAAKYALAAFIDELVLSSSWPERSQWMGTPLQLQFFGEHLAGEGFFKKLQELRQNILTEIDVVEVYYACLQLGFEGIYRLQGLEKLLALQVDLRSQIDSIRGNIDPKISPNALAKTTVLTRVGLRLPYWVIGSVTAACVLFIYLGFTAAIDHQANKTLTTINQSQQVLLQKIKT